MVILVGLDEAAAEVAVVIEDLLVGGLAVGADGAVAEAGGGLLQAVAVRGAQLRVVRLAEAAATGDGQQGAGTGGLLT